MTDHSAIDALKSFGEEISAGEFWAVGTESWEKLEAEAQSRYQFEPYILPFADFASGHERAVLKIGVGMGSDHWQWSKAAPSRTEGFSIVYLEAAASGVPVLGSKIDGNREALGDGRLGVIVDPDNPEELRRGILDDLSRPMGPLAKGLEDYFFPHFEARVHAAIENIVSTGRGNIDGGWQ